MPKDGKDKSKDKSASKPVASQDGDSDIEEEQIKVWFLLCSIFGISQITIYFVFVQF